MPSPATSVWTRLYNDLKVSIPGATDAVLQQELFRCAKEFFTETNIWTEEIDMPVVPGTLSYTLTAPAKGAIKRLLLLYNPAQIFPYKSWVNNGIQMQVPGVVTLTYSPNQAETWKAVVAKYNSDPTNSANYPDIDTASQWIVDDYRDAFYYGTLSYIQFQPSKPYTNLKQAAANRQMYISKRGQARTDALKANIFGGQRWVFPQGYATIPRQSGA